MRIGIDFSATREFLRLPSVTPLPGAPAIIEGIINLRGEVVPVFNLCRRFRLPEGPPHPNNHLVVALTETRLVAFRVDRIIGFVDVANADLTPLETISPQMPHLSGVARLPEGMFAIHDLERFLSEAEAQELDSALEQASTAYPKEPQP